MPLPNVFSADAVQQLVDRIEKLQPTSTPLWGKMNVAQMLAHCNVPYEMTYENKHAKPNALLQLILKWFVKKGVTNETPYKHNMRTAPAFLMTDTKDFEVEKNRLIQYIKRTQEHGEAYFDGKESHSFGKLTVTEWNNMFYKHLDHHLRQFGV